MKSVEKEMRLIFLFFRLADSIFETHLEFNVVLFEDQNKVMEILFFTSTSAWMPGNKDFVHK